MLQQTIPHTNTQRLQSDRAAGTYVPYYNKNRDWHNKDLMRNRGSGVPRELYKLVKTHSLNIKNSHMLMSNMKIWYNVRFRKKFWEKLIAFPFMTCTVQKTPCPTISSIVARKSDEAVAFLSEPLPRNTHIHIHTDGRDLQSTPLRWAHQPFRSWGRIHWQTAWCLHKSVFLNLK